MEGRDDIDLAAITDTLARLATRKPLRTTTLLPSGPTFFHGDFDYGSLRVANVLFDRLPVRSCRFDPETYRSVVAALTCAPSMTHLVTKVEEERGPDTLMNDLAGRAHSGS